MTDIRKIIHDVVDHNPDTDVDILVDKAFDKIPADEHANALRQALRTVMVDILGERRLRAIRRLDAERPNRSWRRDGVRAALDEVFFGPEGPKRVGDATVDDARYAAKHRRDLAERNAAWADWWDRVADMLEEHGAAAMVRDLPSIPPPPGGGA